MQQTHWYTTLINLDSKMQSQYHCATLLVTFSNGFGITLYEAEQSLNLRPICTPSSQYFLVPISSECGFHSTAAKGYWSTRSNFTWGININDSLANTSQLTTPTFPIIVFEYQYQQKLRGKLCFKRHSISCWECSGCTCGVDFCSNKWQTGTSWED